ncbi:hypothetical protein BC332_08207 [Capsicum chinense]|nr:hypothetical protein BC332_08207 [Capsicum chinense]
MIATTSPPPPPSSTEMVAPNVGGGFVVDNMMGRGNCQFLVARQQNEPGEVGWSWIVLSKCVERFTSVYVGFSVVIKHVSCGNASLESSYEEVGRCVYTSTLLFECGGLGLKPVDVKESCFGWRIAYSKCFEYKEKTFTPLYFLAKEPSFLLIELY